MFAQITSISTPLSGMDTVRQMIRLTYLPLVRTQSGFLRDYFLEQVDDPDHAQLIMVWESQAAFERFRSTEAAAGADDTLRQLSLRVESAGYVARMGTSPLSAPGLVT